MASMAAVIKSTEGTELAAFWEQRGIQIGESHGEAEVLNLWRSGKTYEEAVRILQLNQGAVHQ